MCMCSPPCVQSESVLWLDWAKPLETSFPPGFLLPPATLTLFKFPPPNDPSTLMRRVKMLVCSVCVSLVNPFSVANCRSTNDSCST